MIGRAGVAAIVTDIEGTTGSIAFVHEVLFPFARARLGRFIAEHPAEAGPALAEIRASEGPLSEAQIVALLERWTDEDRKAAPLKTLQGLIWREGYESGAFAGHVYDDAVGALRAWRAAGLRLYVYSSGSVQGQKLLFGHSTAGDLTPLFDGWFDTAIGTKTEAESYRRIAARIGVAPHAILFLSDAEAEIAAAAAAGLQTVRLARDGAPGPGEAASFADIAVNG